MSINPMEKRESIEALQSSRGLLRARAFIGVAVILALLSLPMPHPKLLTGMVAAWAVSLVVQWLLSRQSLSAMADAAMQLMPDCLFASVIVGLTGGIYSPFALLFGLVVLGSVVVGLPLFSISLSIVACSAYLVSGYLGVSAPLDMQDTLQLLLQTSAIMLVGGVMGALAGRQQRLQQNTRAVQVRHRSLQKLYAHVLDGMREGIVILDEHMRIRDFNSAALELLQLSHDIEGVRLHEVLQGLNALQSFLRNPVSTVFQCESQSGGHVLLIRVMRMQGDADAAWMVTIVDISHVRDLERQLAEQEKMAALGQMASMLAHEIRNPLQTMAQAHELMQQADHDRRGEIVGIVQDELQRLNRLVSDMLNYARPMQPRAELHSAQDIVSLAVHQADPEGKHQVSRHIGLEDIRIDADHFRLVLDNLLSNALRASPEKGSVRVELEPWEQGWVMRVSDRGGGIDSVIRQRLFEPFATARSDGLGLGLATVWHVCRVNGWQIEARDQDGGTCFEVRSEVNKGHGEDSAG